MIFLDSTGFFALTGLLVQVGLAWLLVAVFALLRRHGSTQIWFRHWLVAFAALGCGLTAIGARFIVVASPELTLLVGEGAPTTRAIYAVYLCCKMVFAWQLLAGVVALRHGDRQLPRWLLVGLVVYGAAGGALAPTVETALLLQIPVLFLIKLIAGIRLQRFHRERRDPGSRIAAHTLLLWAGLWLLYLVPVLGVVTQTAVMPIWLVLLRLAVFFDLTAQVALGAGMIALVLQDEHHAKLVALAERDRLREALVHDEKLRAIGTLVSGVAHELNNPLTAVLGFADDLDSPDHALRTRAAQVVREQAERCRGIVQNLSLLAGSRAQGRDAVDITDLIARVARGFAPQLATAGVTLEIDSATAIPAVRGDRIELEQVLTNLVANALHATPAGGSITLRTRASAGWVEISVLDTGHGVSPEITKRLFEPFFTTKATGQGTGLGLALARALARAHGGDVRLVRSAAGAGAEFALTLPVPVAAPAPGVTRPPAVGVAGRRRLLVVDDEQAVREVVARFAAARGWQVTQAAGGEAALSLLLADRAAFDAVVCDLRMPAGSGIEVHDRLLREAPALLRRFVFVTGDLASPEAAAFARRCECPLLEKPFDLERLLAELAMVAVPA